MKKTNWILNPILVTLAVGVSSIPLISLTSCNEQDFQPISEKDLEVKNGILKGFSPEVKEKGLKKGNVLDLTIFDSSNTPITSIADNAFWNANADFGYSIKKIIFNKDIQYIGESAFSGCYDVEFVDFSAVTSNDQLISLVRKDSFARWNEEQKGLFALSAHINQETKDVFFTDLYSKAGLKYKWFSLEYLERNTTGMCAEVMSIHEWERLSKPYKSYTASDYDSIIKLYLDQIDIETNKLILVEDMIQWHIEQRIKGKFAYPYEYFYFMINAESITIHRENNIPWGLSCKVITKILVENEQTPIDMVVQYNKLPIVVTPDAAHARLTVSFSHTRHPDDWSIKITSDELFKDEPTNSVTLAAEPAEGVKGINEFKTYLHETYPESDFMRHYLVEDIYDNIQVNSNFLKNVKVKTV